LGVFEIILFLIVALIVIPPDHLPEVMRTVGKILRELRLASNTVVRELSGALEDPYYVREQQTTPPPQTDGGTPSSGEPPKSPPPG